MPSIIDQAQQAGFSPDEISQWATGFRAQAKGAGFSDDEVSAYLGGTVLPPKEAPTAFLDRIVGGQVQNRVLGAVTKGAVQGWGSAPLGEQTLADMRASGMISDPSKGQPGPLRLLTDAINKPIGIAVEALERATSAGITGVGTGFGQIARELGGSETTAGQVEREAQNLATFLGTEAGVGPPHFATPEIAADGTVRDAAVGTTPKGEDFAAAAKSIVGDSRMSAQEKLLRLYTEKGVHPAEVAADAAHDPLVTQALASSGTDLPERYHGEMPLGGEPVKPPEPVSPSAPEAQASLPAEHAPAIGTVPPSAGPSIPSEFPNAIRSFRPGDLAIDADRFQFKAGGDEAGVTERLRGVEAWDPIKAGLGLVWEDQDGRNFIVDGHQRLGLAKQIGAADPAQDPQMNAIVVRQADGVSDMEARVMAASKNIAEGTGTAVDAAKIMRDRPDLIRELPPRSELVRQARGLAELGDEPFRMVVNEVVPPNYGAIVGRLAPQDEKLQGALLNLLAKTEPANAVQAESIVRQGIDAGTHTETQATLFGDQEQISSLYLDRAKILDRTLRDLRSDNRTFTALVRDEDVIAATGNQLETSANAKRATADSQAIQILQTLANRRGPLSDALSGAARAAGGGDRAGAVREFVGFVRGQIESGDLVRAADGLDRGRADAGRQDAANIVDTSAAADRNDEQRAGRDAATIIGETTERAPQGEQIVMPGMERSAVQAAAGREAEGHGRIAPQAPQEAPGGMFATPAPGEPGFDWGPETGAIAWGPRPPRTPLDEARESVAAKLSVGEPGPRRGLSFDRLYTSVVDRLYPIPDEGPTSANPYRLSRLLSGLAGKINHMIDGPGTLDWATGEVNGPSLKRVLEPVKNDFDNFRYFAVSARVLELEARGIETGFDVAAAREIARAGIDKYAPVMEQLVGFQNRVAQYLRDSGVLSKAGYEKMTELYPLYIPMQRVMGDGDGWHGPGQTIQAQNPIHRIEGSLRTVVDPIESIIRNTASLTTMAERNEVARALIDTLLSHDALGYGPRKAVEPVAIKADADLDAALRDYLTAHGVDHPEDVLDLLKAAAEAPPEVGTVSVFRDGTRYSYKVDPEIAAAMKGLDADSAGLLERILSPFTRALRAGAVLSPEFGLRHPIRDFFYAAITGKFSPMDMARGYAGMVAKSEEFWRWQASGGANVTMVSLDRRYLQEDIERLTQQTGLLTRTINTVIDPNSAWLDRGSAVAGLPFKAAQRYVLRPLQVFTELAESASHLGKFIQESRRTIGETGEPLTRAQLQEAGFASRDIAVDAARMGAKMRAYNMISAFANITIQDTDRWIRAFREDPVTTSFKVMAYITVPQILLYLAQHDDPRYNEIPAWERVLTIPILTDKWEDAGPASQYGPPNPGTPYRVVGDRLQVNNGAIFRIPQPWSMGVIFGAGAVALLSAYQQQSAKPLWDILHGLGQVATTGLPNAIVPPIEQFANRSIFTDRTLIPGQLEKQLPEYQYTPYTTEAAKALGRIVGAFPGMRAENLTQTPAGGVARALTSPILLENYVRGWSGSLGVYALNIADAALRKMGALPDPVLPATTLADIPIIRAFVIRYPTATTQSIQDFEDDYRSNKVYYDTWIAKAKEGDAAAALRIQQLGGPRIFMNLDGIDKVLQEHNKLIRDVYKNPQMTPSDKRQIIDTVYYRMIELGQAGKAALGRINATLH